MAVSVVAVAVAAAPGLVAPPAAAAGVSAAVVKVSGGPERLPRGTRVLGALPTARPLSVDVSLSPADPAALEAFDEAVTTPGSPSFRHFLTPGQFAARFGPAAGAIGATRSWLEGEGLSVGATARDGLLIPVSGSASRLAAAFGIGFDQDRLSTGRIVREPTAPPSVPRALAGVVQGVVGLDDLAVSTPQMVRPVDGRAHAPASAPAGIEPHTGPTACGAAQGAGTTAEDLAQAYSMSSLYPSDEGQGVTVGLYELEPYAPSDIGTFETCYGISPGPTITGVSVDGASPDAGPGTGETALDIEMVVGLVPRANIDVYVGRNTGVGPLDVYAAMVNQDAAQVLSTSWGECEPVVGTAQIEVESTLFQQAAAQGQSVVAAAGDEGSEDCDVPGFSDDTSLEVDDPASQPWVTGVGGTELGALGPPPGETVWNTGVFEGTGGGGISTSWTMPLWQLGPGVENGYTKANDSYTGASPCPLSAGLATVSCREVPDVSADGDPATGYATFCTCGPDPGSWQTIGGTSMGAPLWASVAALADESAPSPGKIGLLNPALYQAGCLATPPFNDVSSGDNQPLGSSPSDPPRVPGGPEYPATAGYDLASGLGSPVASALLADLVTPVDACPAVTSMSVASGPAGGGTAVTLSGANLGAVRQVDFGDAAGSGLSVSGSSVTVTTPASPTGGWDTAEVVVKTADDVIGLDGRNYFTFVGQRGYWTVASDGGVFTFGHVGYYRSLGGVHLQKPVVGMAPTPSSRGYWLVASDGGIFAFGDAGFHGSMGGRHLNAPVVGMAATPDGAGYWLVASDGGIFAFGDAGFYGSMGGRHLNAPVVGMAATPDGAGYWLVASDGGIFAFGDAGFYGSMGGRHLNAPVVGMAATPDGAGYWLVASDGGIFSFGNAHFYGSAGAVRLAEPVVGMATPYGGGGYWLVASDGGIFAYGDATFAGSMGGHPLHGPMVGMGGS